MYVYIYNLSSCIFISSHVHVFLALLFIDQPPYGSFHELAARFGIPHNKDQGIWGSILGPPLFGSSHIAVGLKYCSQNGGEQIEGPVLESAPWYRDPYCSIYRQSPCLH